MSSGILSKETQPRQRFSRASLIPAGRARPTRLTHQNRNSRPSVTPRFRGHSGGLFPFRQATVQRSCIVRIGRGQQNRLFAGIGASGAIFSKSAQEGFVGQLFGFSTSRRMVPRKAVGVRFVSAVHRFRGLFALVPFMVLFYQVAAFSLPYRRGV